ncbi:MAG: SulP family inorganic anion transporter [Candidatus Methylacidiphilales bacterium]|nr:SulP family inorganic anion transporter [Candidatus Methylacidiphilales bacterium]
MRKISDWPARLWLMGRSLAAKSNLRVFPLRESLRGYHRLLFLRDLRAGCNVALLDFPQGIAYAMIAGLPAQYGIFTSAVASLVGPFFSSSRYVMLGPTNATAVLVLSGLMVLPAGVDHMVVMPVFLLLVGLFLVVGAFCRVAGLVQYVSQTVVTAYITGAAALIIVNQIHAVLGFDTGDAASFFAVLQLTIARIGDTQWQSLFLGATTALFYLAFQQRVKKVPAVAATLLVMSVLGSYLQIIGWNLEFIASPVGPGWIIHLPWADFRTLSQLASAALAVAFLSLVETSSIAKSLANRSGDRMDANQQMLGLGLANTASAFLGGMPASGSLTRSVLNWSSHAASPVSSWISGLLVAAGALLLSGWLHHIPRPVLGVLVIMVGVSLINGKQIRIALNSTGSDRITFLVTLGSALFFTLDFAIYLGVAVSIILFLRKASSPQLVEYSFNDQGNLYEIADKSTRAHPRISIVHVEGDLFFGAAELFRDQVRFVSEDPDLKVIILRLKNAHHLDATSVSALEELIRYLREQGRHLIVSGARKEVYRVFLRSGLIEVLGRENFFMGSPDNPNVSTRNALRRAQELLGDVKAEVKIYYDPDKHPNNLMNP